MATPAQLRIFQPLHVWFAVNGGVLLLLIAAAISIVSISDRESHRLVKLQSDTLIRARIHDIDRGNFRAFVEGIGQNLSEVFIEIKSTDGVFFYGPSDLTICESTTIPRASSIVEVRVCRKSSAPYASLILVVLTYALVSFFVWLVLMRLESYSTTLLLDFFESLGIKIAPQGGLVGLLRQVKSILGDLEDARNREIELTRQAALVATARQVAHDIRSPIAALKASLDNQNTSKDNNESARLARKAISRIETIAQDLLTRGRGKDQSTLVDFSVIITDILKERQIQKNESSNIDFSLNIEPSAKNVGIFADPVALSRVLSNLLNNAVEAINKKGQINIHLAVQYNHLECSITDTGKGIPEDILPQLMQPGATFGKSDGSGLGLYYARQCIEAWQAHLTIQSILDQGTTVQMCFPLPTPKSQEQAFNSSSEKEFDSVIILIDDDIWLREAWEMTASRLGKTVRSFASSFEFFSVLSQIPIDTSIYIDFELEHERGDEVGKKLFELGYQRLYLTTGHDPSTIGPFPWFKAIIGKDPPIQQ